MSPDFQLCKKEKITKEEEKCSKKDKNKVRTMNNRYKVGLLLMTPTFKFGKKMNKNKRGIQTKNKKLTNKKMTKMNSRSKVALLIMRPTFNFGKKYENAKDKKMQQKKKMKK